MSTFTPYTGLEKPEPGSQIDVWGDTLNSNSDRLDQALKGMKSISVSGDYTVTYANDSTDEAHYSMFNVVGGSGGNIILGGKQAWYIIINNAGGTVNVKNTTGAVAPVVAGEIGLVFNDGANCKTLGNGTMSLKSYIDKQLQDAKDYADSLAFGSNPGTLPSQAGQAGKYLTTNGTNAIWQNIAQSDVTGLTATISDLKAFAIAAAIVF